MIFYNYLGAAHPASSWRVCRLIGKISGNTLFHAKMQRRKEKERAFVYTWLLAIIQIYSVFAG